MLGRVILISGLSGAGKTTLLHKAVKRMPSLAYIITYTTRPQRQGETNTHEYRFVDNAAYEAQKASATRWDELAYDGYRYGADTAAVLDGLKAGRLFMAAVAPSMAIIEELARLYQTKPFTVWLDTPEATALSRISHDEARRNRQETAAIKSRFDVILTPSGAIEDDAETLLGYIRHMTEGAQ